MNIYGYSSKELISNDLKIEGDLNVDDNITATNITASANVNTPQVSHTGSSMTVGTGDAQTLVLQTNSTSALTIDTSQNTVIKGDLKTNGMTCSEMKHVNDGLMWDSSNKGTYITLSNGSKTALGSYDTNLKYVKSTIPITRETKATYYVRIDGFSGSHCMIGLAQNLLNVNTTVDYSYSVWFNANNGDSGDYINNVKTLYSSFTAISPGDIVKLVNDGLGNLLFYKDTFGNRNFSLIYSRSYKAITDSNKNLYLFVGDGAADSSGFQATILNEIFVQEVLTCEKGVLSLSQFRGYTLFSTTNHYTLLEKDEYLLVSTAVAPITVTLPQIGYMTELETKYKKYVIKDMGVASVYNITIVPTGTDRIDSQTSKVISTDFGVVTLINDGTSKWYVV